MRTRGGMVDDGSCGGLKVVIKAGGHRRPVPHRPPRYDEFVEVVEDHPVEGVHRAVQAVVDRLQLTPVPDS